MNEAMITPFEKIRAVLISLILFLFPFIFLPITTEFYATNKQYFLLISTALLTILSLVALIKTQKAVGKFNTFDIPVFMFVVAISFSVLLVSPNKIMALTAPVSGLLSLVSLAGLYFFLSRERHESHLSSYVTILQYAVTLICIIEIAVYFFATSGISLPENLKFLASPQFTTLGSIVDLVAFLGFFFVYSGIRICISIANREWNISEILSFVLTTAALALAALTFFKTPPAEIPYAPFDYSFKAIPYLFTNPLTAVFGYGVDNFAALFTRAKDASYSTSAYSAIPTFAFSRSALLHTLSEAGIVGLFTLLVIFFRGMVESFSLPKEVKIATFGLFLYMLVAFFVFPPSLVLLFLLFITLGLLHHDIVAHSERHQAHAHHKASYVAPGFTVIATIVMVCMISWGGYHLIMFYQADVSYRKSVQSINNRNLAQTYADQFNAIALNPYAEKYHISFSQTNIFIANQIAVNAKNAGGSLSQTDQTTITNAIKTAIQESRAPTILNPQKAANWEARARIYKNLLGVADKADVFAIGAYERAVLLDPYNPVYKNDLAEIYYLTKQFTKAEAYFTEAITLKPDYTNAKYNLAWSQYQLGRSREAIRTMESIMIVLENNPESPEYKKARTDLDRFKKNPINGG